MNSVPTTMESGTHHVEGNILLFYSFDFGDEIDFDMVVEKGLLNVTESSFSPVFKDYRAPISFRLRDKDEKILGQEPYVGHTIFNRIYDFGVLSFCYKIPFKGTLDLLRSQISDIEKYFTQKSEIDAREAYDDILPALNTPNFYNTKNSYLVVQVNPMEEYINPTDFKEKYGPKIASLLRLEKQNLSEYQRDEILSSVTGYYGEDLIIIDAEAAFIYDNEYFEALEFIEAALIERLELEYFDRVLDKKLRAYYAQDRYRIPWKAYIPVVSRQMDLPISQLTRLRVDILVITDRLKNSVKISGDPYYAKLYSMLVQKLSLKDWRDSIDKKLNIFKDIYTVYQDRLDTIHEEMLTIVIIILIAVEAFKK